MDVSKGDVIAVQYFSTICINFSEIVLLLGTFLPSDVLNPLNLRKYRTVVTQAIHKGAVFICVHTALG